MTARVEVFATGAADPARVWEVVGDLRRLMDWTDAEYVEASNDIQPGTEFVTIDHGRRLRWRVVTFEPGLIEAVSDLPLGRLGVGARVTRDPAGTRVVLAGAIDSARGRLRARVLHAPALRRRFDRWCRAALRAASGE